jgi:hypothetical protein
MTSSLRDEVHRLLDLLTGGGPGAVARAGRAPTAPPRRATPDAALPVSFGGNAAEALAAGLQGAEEDADPSPYVPGVGYHEEEDEDEEEEGHGEYGSEGGGEDEPPYDGDDDEGYAEAYTPVGAEFGSAFYGPKIDDYGDGW